MKLSLVDWQQLAARSSRIRDELVELSSDLIKLISRQAFVLADKDDAATCDHLLKVLKHLDSARSSMSVVDNGVRPISEWTGGETWKWREPASCYGGLSARRYFTPEEVDAYMATLPGSI